MNGKDVMKRLCVKSVQTLVVIAIVFLYSFNAHAIGCNTMTNSCTGILNPNNCCNNTASGSVHCPSPMPAEPSDCVDAGAASPNPLRLSCKWDYYTNTCGWAHPR
ncbi:MAG: hypothetical protein Q8R24_03105 [Legionellaceae bacterium]|nr:hypothetical protein [Legionellaceae bacterium]